MAKDPLEMLRKQAQDAIAHGHYQDARHFYEQALTYRDDSPEVHYGLATACFLLADLESAARHFKESAKLDPLRAGAFINLGAVYNRLGRYDEAVAALQRGIKLDAGRAEGFYNLGVVYRQIGQFEMAVHAYRESVRLNPRMHDAHYNLGNIFFEKGQFGLAIAHYKSALDIRPNWEKGLAALAAAEQEQAALNPSPSAGQTGSPRPTPAASLDLGRLIDPAIHGNLLRTLHEVIVETDHKSQGMLEFLQKEVEVAIRQLSICILTPKDGHHDLDAQIRHFDEVVTRLQELQDAFDKRIARAKSVGEQIINV